MTAPRTAAALAVLAIANTGCIEHAPTARPHVLAAESARISQIEGVPPAEWFNAAAAVPVQVEWTHCLREAPRMQRPRIVIDEPACAPALVPARLLSE